MIFKNACLESQEKGKTQVGKDNMLLQIHTIDESRKQKTNAAWSCSAHVIVTLITKPFPTSPFAEQGHRGAAPTQHQEGQTPHHIHPSDGGNTTLVGGPSCATGCLLILAGCTPSHHAQAHTHPAPTCAWHVCGGIPIHLGGNNFVPSTTVF